MQGLFTGVGAGLGALGGGIVYGRYGGQAMFAVTGAAVTLGWLLLIVGQLVIHSWGCDRSGRGAEAVREPLLAPPPCAEQCQHSAVLVNSCTGSARGTALIGVQNRV